MSSSATSSGAGAAPASASTSTSASRSSSSFNSMIPGEGDASSARMADMGDDELLCVNFNQDSTCCVLGTTSGYRILNFNPFGHNSYQAGGGIGIVEMLFCTSLIAIVGGGASPASSPRKLKLWDSKRSLTICELDFGAAVHEVSDGASSPILVSCSPPRRVPCDIVTMSDGRRTACRVC
jgi:hypothetical protein